MKTPVKYLCAICIFLLTSLAVYAETISGIDPASAAQGINQVVTITGNGTTFYKNGSTITNVWLSQGSSIIDANSFEGINANTLTADFDIPVDAKPGLWDLHVDNTINGELTLASGLEIYVYPDLNADGKVDLKDLALYSRHYLENQGPTGMVFVPIDNDPGIGAGYEGFDGEMSKYLTTNAQYCQFLNMAIKSGDIYVSNNKVYGKNGTNTGTDFVGQVYFETYATDSDSQIVYSNGSFSVRSRNGYDMGNHPVAEVSWYGAAGFCNYFGWYLPSEWQWQAVADFDGSYTYGCGTSIDHSKANYASDNPLNLSSDPYTTSVYHYPAYGYGINSMTGSMFEWTDSWYSDAQSKKVLRGGSWGSSETKCTVSYRNSASPTTTSYDYGFRPCR